MLAGLPGSGRGGAGKAVGAAADPPIFWSVLLPLISLLFPLLFPLLLSLTAPGRPFLRAPGVEGVLVRHSAHLEEAEGGEEEGRKKRKIRREKRPLLCKYRYTHI